MKTCSKCNTEKEIFEFYKGNVCRFCYLENKKKYYLKNKERISASKKEYALKNDVYIKNKRAERYLLKKEIFLSNQKKYQLKNKDKKKKYDFEYRNKKAKYKTFSSRIKIYNYIEESQEGFLIVKCHYCGNKFIPNNGQCKDRIYGIEKKGLFSENNFYCSDDCKEACPVYRTRKYFKNNKKRQKRETSKEFNDLVFNERNNECEKCGSKNNLHIHHIKGYTQYPELRFDLNNVLLLCKECHKDIHKTKGCGYNDISCKKGG